MKISHSDNMKDNSMHFSLDEDKFKHLPVADWVLKLSEGEAEYVEPSSHKKMNEEYFESKRKKQ